MYCRPDGSARERALVLVFCHVDFRQEVDFRNRPIVGDESVPVRSGYVTVSE